VKILAILVAILCSTTASQGEEWQRAELYFIDWDVLTRASLTPERVRELADCKRTFTHDASEVARTLALDKLRPVKNKEREDARLVVDLFTDTGHRLTYYASRFNLCTADSARKHSVGGQFRRYFSRLMKSRQRPNQSMKLTAGSSAINF